MHCIFLQRALGKLLLFSKLDSSLQRKVVSEMYERSVAAGEILIKEGDTGLAATELYVVKSGKFEVSMPRLHAVQRPQLLCRNCCGTMAHVQPQLKLHGH